MSDTVRFYTAEEIDQPLMAWLDENHLYQSGHSGKCSSLRKIYRRMKRLGLHDITHLWVMCSDGDPVAVALLEHREGDSLQLFVKPDYRYAGRGERLLRLALRAGVKFGVYYTGMSRPLYEKYRLVNLCDTTTST